MRGWRWTAEGNDYIVHSNRSFERHILINDGEGIMHEAFANSTIKDSRIINNRGNRYLCLWDTPVDGLEIRGNRVSDDGDPAIHVLGRGHAVRNLRIVGNVVDLGAIQVTAAMAENTVIADNRYAGRGTGQIRVYDAKWVGKNESFSVQIKQEKRRR
jgi:hypothetical protein